MTHPTKAICPILLEDYRKITLEKKVLQRNLVKRTVSLSNPFDRFLFERKSNLSQELLTEQTFHTLGNIFFWKLFENIHLTFASEKHFQERD